MAKYKIVAEYRTGDTFKTYDTECPLDPVWEDLDKAKAALQRIREHWDWYEYIDKRRGWHRDNELEVAEPEWHKSIIGKEYIALELDDGSVFNFWPPWCGYFERLYGARITTDTDDLSFRV